MALIKYTITTYKCPKCGCEVNKEYNGGSAYGEKYGRCPKCGYIYKTGKKLYSDLSEREKNEQKKQMKEVYIILVPVFLISLVLTILTGWELFGLVAFMSGFVTLFFFLSNLSDKSKTLKNVSQSDKELYDLEMKESELIKNKNAAIENNSNSTLNPPALQNNDEKFE